MTMSLSPVMRGRWRSTHDPQRATGNTSRYARASTASHEAAAREEKSVSVLALAHRIKGVPHEIRSGAPSDRQASSPCEPSRPRQGPAHVNFYTLYHHTESLEGVSACNFLPSIPLSRKLGMYSCIFTWRGQWRGSGAAYRSKEDAHIIHGPCFNSLQIRNCPVPKPRIRAMAPGAAARRACIPRHCCFPRRTYTSYDNGNHILRS